MGLPNGLDDGVRICVVNVHRNNHVVVDNAIIASIVKSWKVIAVAICQSWGDELSRCLRCEERGQGCSGILWASQRSIAHVREVWLIE